MKTNIKVRHIGLVCPNLKKSINFWCNELGFKIKKRMKEEGSTIDSLIGYKNVNLETVKISDQYDNLIELLYFKNSPRKKISWKGKPYSNGFTHLALTVKNVDSIYKRLKKKGTKFNSQPKISKDGNVKLTYCRTPEGVYVELVQPVKK